MQIVALIQKNPASKAKFTENELVKKFNRPGVAGAVLQSPLSFINSLSEIFKECSSHTICHVSCVMCHMSRVMFHLSHVTCHLSHVIF